MLSGGYRNFNFFFNFLQQQKQQQRFQGVALDKGGCRISAASDKGVAEFLQHQIKGLQNFSAASHQGGLHNFCNIDQGGCRISAETDQEFGGISAVLDHKRGCRLSLAPQHVKRLRNFCSIHSSATPSCLKIVHVEFNLCNYHGRDDFLRTCYTLQK